MLHQVGLNLTQDENGLRVGERFGDNCALILMFNLVACTVNLFVKLM